MSARPIWLSWSGGKDSLIALARLRADPAWHVAGAITTITETFDRVAMHGIRRDVLHAQCTRLRLPLVEARLPWPSDNATYEAAFADALVRAGSQSPGLAHVAFGDLFLADVRAFREAMLARMGVSGVFPLWGEDTTRLARTFIADGHRARLACVDTQQLDAAFGGRDYDAALLDALPATVDPCGEHGEFHTLAIDGPSFASPLRVVRGETIVRDGRFALTDFVLADDGEKVAPRRT